MRAAGSRRIHDERNGQTLSEKSGHFKMPF